MDKCHGSSKMDRKTAEKIRRTHMKELYSKLNSLTSIHKSKEAPMLLSDQLEAAANYIKSLQEKLEQMKERKNYLKENKVINNSHLENHEKAMDLQLPHVEIKEFGYALVVLLICALDSQFVFYKTICILEEEGVEVVNASFFVMGGKAFHTIHSKISYSHEDDFEATRVSERLYKLVNESSDDDLRAS